MLLWQRQKIQALSRRPLESIPGMTVTNQQIADLFQEMASLHEMKGDLIFKTLAYQKAANIISELPQSLESMVHRSENLKDIPGIGDAISKKIHEFVTTGRVASYDRLRAELPDYDPAHNKPSQASNGVPISPNPQEALLGITDQPDYVLVHRVSEALRHLTENVKMGRPWLEVLLEAMSMWTVPEEQRNGRLYKYIIQGEAFDWLLLVERMCDALDDLDLAHEMEDLLFRGRFPVEVTPENLKESLGYNKYRGILNFWYGVVVEEALHMAVEEEVRKEMRAGGRVDVEDVSDAIFRRIYDDGQFNLVGRFRKEMGYPKRVRFSLTQAKEFTYWLFKLRLQYWDPARVASDTRKGLKWLQRVRGSHSPV